MADAIKPQKVQVFGRRRFWWVDTIADPAAPTAAEINAGEYLACYPLNDQGMGTTTINRISLAALMCETEEEEVFGTRTHAHPDLAFAWDPQAAAASPGKKAWDVFEPEPSGFIVWMIGADTGDDQIEAGDFVTVVPADTAIVGEEPNTTGQEAIAMFQVAVAVKSPYIQRNVAVVASGG